MNLRSHLCQRILDRTRLHEGNAQTLDITDAIAPLLVLAIDHLIIELEHLTRIVRQILTIRGIDHHPQIHLSVQDIFCDILPSIG